jgi:hypothetical protein
MTVKKYHEYRCEYFKKTLDDILFDLQYYDMNILGIIEKYLYVEAPTFLQTCKYNLLGRF